MDARIIYLVTQAHEYRGPGDPSEDVLLFEASTTAAPAAVHENGSMSADAAVGHVQRLPSGTLVSGLPAAILSNCQVSCHLSICKTLSARRPCFCRAQDTTAAQR